MRENVDNWGRFVAFPNLKLLRFIGELNKGKLFGTYIPMTKFGKIADVGIDAHQFHDSFKTITKKAIGSYPIIYGGGEEQRTHLLGECNYYALPVNEKADAIFKQKSSYLLVPDRIWIVTAHVISMFLPSKTLSNIFYAVKLSKHESAKKYKALCVWINSTFGLLLILMNRQETRSAWIRLKMSHWRLQTVLDITKVDREFIKKLSAIFDKYANKEMPRLPQQYNPEIVDPTRLAFDKEVLDALNIKLKEEDLREIYRMIFESFSEWFGVGKIQFQKEKNAVLSKEKE